MKGLLNHKIAMLYINYDHPFDHLRKLAHGLGADFKEYQDSAILILDNSVGKGTVTTYSVFEGLNVIVYDVTFNEDLKISKMEQDPPIIYFLYCVKGHFFHRFENQENNNKILPRQNVIFSSSAKAQNIITFPGKVHLKLSAILVRDSSGGSNSKRKTLMETALHDITSSISKEKPFSYYGEISPLTSKYATILIDNKRSDAVGKLLVKGAVVNTLASQVEHYDIIKADDRTGFAISKTEILRISQVAEHIAENIDQSLNIDQLSKKFGLSPKKLQTGFRHLFGKSPGNFITHLRLEKGKELIQHTDLTISEVCYKIGFSSRSYFSRSFYERFGLLPSKFKSTLTSKNLIYELTYKSTMSPTTQISDIEDIIEVATQVNQENNITGCLVCQDNNFFQFLEGPKSKVLLIYDKIKKDQRHHDLKVLTRKLNANRFFPNWGMALLSDKNAADYNIKNKAINLNLDTSGIRGNENVQVSSTVFWRKVLSIIKVSQT